MSQTAIPCTEETRDRLRRLKDGRDLSWDELLNQLADEITDDDLSGGDLEDRLADLEKRVSDIESMATKRR